MANKMTGDKIELIDFEVELVKIIGGRRYSSNRNAGVPGSLIMEDGGAAPDAEIDIQAFGAELAFCKLHNLYPDLTLMIRTGSDDCSLPFKPGVPNRSIDVKWTGRKNGRLIVAYYKKNLASDIYVLMRGHLPMYEYLGWIYARDLFKPENVELLTERKIKTYVAPFGKLNRILPW